MSVPIPEDGALELVPAGRGVHELRAGGLALGRLERRGGLWAVWGDRRWRLAGGWRGTIRATDDAGREAARWEGVHRRRGAVVLADGRRVPTERRGWWRPCWALSGPARGELLRLFPRTGFGRRQADLRLCPGAAREPEIGLLCLLACVAARRAQDAAAGGAISAATVSG